MLVRNPCKNLKSYDNPLCQFSNGGNNKNKNKKNKNNNKSGKIPKIVAYGAFDETVCTAPLGPTLLKICWFITVSSVITKVIGIEDASKFLFFS